jgi:YNFM family putative membrane transporter
MSHPDSLPGGVLPKTFAFFRIQVALFFGGFATFSMLYGVQPLFPLFVDTYGISPAKASIALSTTTGVMSVMLVAMSLVSDRFGRRVVLLTSLFAAGALMVACAFTPNFDTLLVLRTIQGVALAGPPAVAMAYLAEEVDYSGLGFAMGFYIAGTAFGGMSGRFICAWIAEHTSWTTALGIMGVTGLVMSVACLLLLPPSRRFRPRPMRLSTMVSGALDHLKDGFLPWLFLMGFVLMGCFVSVYNYLPFRLMQAPFSLSTGQVGSVFLLYVVGMFASASTGRIADKYGLPRVFPVVMLLMLGGTLLTLSMNLWVILVGIAVLTFGFFGSHAVASSWVGRRATEARGLAAALYLWAYYFGSSVIGTLSGTLWGEGGWGSIIACLTAIMVGGVAVAAYLLAKSRREG